MARTFLGACARRIIYPCIDFFARLTTKSGQIVDSNDILIVRTDHIGDFILFTPAFALIKEKFPESRLVFIGNNALEDIAFRFPIDEFIPFDLKKFRINLLYRIKFLRLVRRRSFKTVINPVFFKISHGESIVRLTSAVEKIGIKGDDASLYTKLIPIDPSIESELSRNKAFVEGLGIIVEEFVPKILLREEDHIRAKEILENLGLHASESFAVVAPGAGWSGRRWPAEKFAEVIKLLYKEGITTVLVGAPGRKDRSLANRIKKEAGVTLIDLVGRVSLPTLAAALKMSRCYVGNDSGAVHIAAAVGTPAVCIMGGGNFKRFFPYGDLKKNRIVFSETAISGGCRGCNWTCPCCLSTSGLPGCISGVTVDQVVEEIRWILALPVSHLS